MQHCRYLVKLFLVFSAACGVFSSPTPKDEVEETFKGSKRDASSAGSAAAASLIKSSLFNPYLYQPIPPFFPGKPYLYPFLTPTDILLNRFARSNSIEPEPTMPQPIKRSASPDAYFKSKKDEFLSKLFEKINSDSDSTDIAARSLTSAAEDPDEPTKATFDPSFFISKKMDFLDKLFKSLNATTTMATPAGTTEATATTPKPTIVPPNFWFPFLKPPKPPKAPKPTKPPKAKKIMKDALDTMILQSLLMDLGIDPTNGTFNKRAIPPAIGAKKMKSKKVKADEEPTEFHIPLKIDPSLYSAKASDCLDKLFKILSKADAEDLSNFIEPKATVIPANMWTQPSETEYTSKLDAFLDLLLKSLNATENSTPPTGKLSKSKKTDPFSKMIRKKRSTFLDELLHRIPPTPTTTVEPSTTSKCKCSTTSCCCSAKCSDEEGTTDKSTRSILFKPFGTGYWIPQYLYAAKMNLYLDKLMETINTAAAEDVSAEGSALKRSLSLEDGKTKVNTTGLNPKEAALTLLIAELVDLKNDMVDAFGDGVKAQKSAATAKPSYNPAGKSFKKPFWGPKPSPTPDPVEPIQKRIDILNDVFDKITEVEKTLLFAKDASDDEVFKSIQDTLQSDVKTGSPRLGASKFSKIKPTENTLQDGTSPDSPDYYIEKTRDFLQSLYASKGLTDGDD